MVTNANCLCNYYWHPKNHQVHIFELWQLCCHTSRTTSQISASHIQVKQSDKHCIQLTDFVPSWGFCYQKNKRDTTINLEWVACHKGYDIVVVARFCVFNISPKILVFSLFLFSPHSGKIWKKESPSKAVMVDTMDALAMVLPIYCGHSFCCRNNIWHIF